MNNKGRIENSIKNTVSGIGVQICSAVMGLVVRTFFIRYLTAEYLGVNGLFSNILTMLSLAEMGIGSAIVYSMYKPIAYKDELKIAKLMNLYRVAYKAVGVLIAALGVSIIPFLGLIIKNKPDINDLTLIYLLFLSNTVFSYFFAYKRAIFSADQMERVINLFVLIGQIVRYTLQVISLIIFSNYIIYLLIQILCTLAENIAISLYADFRYPFLRKYRKEELDSSDKVVIFDNIKALFIYKIGSRALDGTDNIIISAFDGVISVGLLSNYSLITGSLQALLSRVSSALTGSVGNYIAKEKEDSHEQLLDNITFLHFVLYGMVFVGSIAVLSPFIKLWAGDNYLLSDSIVFVHCLNIYIFGLMNAVWLFRSTMGLYVHGKWRPLVSAIINIVVSIFLAKRMGLIGVLLGTTITRITTNVWFDPYIVYKYGIKRSPINYYIKWMEYLVLVLINCSVLIVIKRLWSLSGVLAILVYGTISVIMFMLSVFICFGKSKSAAYYIQIVQRLFRVRL